MSPDHEPGTPAARLVLFAVLGALPFAPALAAQAPSVGLSSVRAQRFHNEVLPPYVPQAEDQFASTVAAGDFNGDGADDLATGIPFDDCLAGVGPIDCGSVVIRYASLGAGLESGLADQILNQQESGSLEAAEVGDSFGSALAACDFDGDGFDDLAVGVPGEDLLLSTITIVDSGVVEVYYGTISGLASPASAVLKSNGIQSGQQRLGAALACGDFDSDGFDDLVVGLPGRNVGGNAGAGRILVYRGSPAGLGVAAFGLDQDTPMEMAGEAEAGDGFGAALAVGNFNDDFFEDLAIGVPGENASAGVVHWLLGDPEDIIATSLNFLFFEDALGGDPEAGDEFGHAFAVGDFDGDGRVDLAIGAPFEDLGAFTDTGNVGVVYGQQFFGLPFDRTQGFDQDAIVGITGFTESGDEFGFALASGDFDRDGRDDLAIGHPLEAGAGEEDGAVTVLMGAPVVGLSPARFRLLFSGYYGIPGDLDEHFKQFGRALGAGDLDGDGYGDLAIGVPHEDEGGLLDVGSEVVLYGSLFADGFEFGGFGSWIVVITP